MSLSTTPPGTWGPDLPSKILTIACALLLVGVCVVLYKLDRIETFTDPAYLPKQIDVRGTIAMTDYLETTWTSARGTERVVTYRKEGESDQKLQERHDARVDIAQAAHPPL